MGPINSVPDAGAFTILFVLAGAGALAIFAGVAYGAYYIYQHLSWVG